MVKRKKITTEKGKEPQIVAEDNAIKIEENKKKYNIEHYLQAIEDLSVMVNNAYFKMPYNRCPKCNQGNNTIMAKFGIDGANTIGNLNGFNATVGDIIAWYGYTQKGLSMVVGKNNGVYKLATSHFERRIDEPAVVEMIVVPSKYKDLLDKMALYRAVTPNFEEYPDVIKRQL